MREGVKIVPLKDVCIDFVVPQRDKPTAFNGDIPWCRIEDIEGRYLNGSKSGQNVTKELADKMNMHMCPKGTVISACSASIGKQAITTVDCYTNQTFIGLVTNSDVLYNVYLYYYLESQTKSLQDLGQGATIKYISQEKYKQMLIPLPSIQEQKRIVGFLDEEFSKINSLRDNAEKNLRDSQRLLQTSIEEALKEEARINVRMDDLCEIVSSLVDPREEQYSKLLHVGGANIESETGRLSDLKTAREEKLISGKFVFDSSMILYSKIRPYLKKVARPDFLGLCSADIYPLKPKEICDKNFLFYLLLSKNFTEYAIEGSSRAGMPKVNRPHLFAYQCTIPTKQKQADIAKRLDLLVANCQELQSFYLQTITLCEDLKQSLLRSIFNEKK